MVAGRHNVAVTGLGATMWLWLGDTMWGWISSHQESPGTLSFVLPLCYVSAMLCTVVRFSGMYSCEVLYSAVLYTVAYCTFVQCMDDVV